MRVVLSSHRHSRLKPSRRFLTLQTRKINWLRKKRGRQNPASEVADWDMLHPARRRRFNMSPGALGAGGGVRLVYQSENTPRLGNPESEEPRMPNNTPRFLRWDDGSRRVGTTPEFLAMTRGNNTVFGGRNST